MYFDKDGKKGSSTLCIYESQKVTQIFFGGQDGRERWEKGNGISRYTHTSAFEFAAAQKYFCCWWLFGDTIYLLGERGRGAWWEFGKATVPNSSCRHYILLLLKVDNRIHTVPKDQKS